MSVLKEEVNESVHKIKHLSTTVEGGATTENEHGGPDITSIGHHHPRHHSDDGTGSLKAPMLWPCFSLTYEQSHGLGNQMDLARFRLVGSC